MELSLDRFRSAHEGSYEIALQEIKNGRKESHWMWYIFPQIQGLGRSTMAMYYEIQGIGEALAYWDDPVLSNHMVEICQELLKLEKPIGSIMGYPDNLKLQSCMTLFYLVTDEQLFKDVLDKYFSGELDNYTVKKLPRHRVNEVGMKIFNVLESNLEIPFCENTTNKDMVLCQYHNKSGEPMFITISRTPLRYRVPKDGRFYCVCCGDEFVQTFPMIKCDGKEIKIRTGTHCCIFTDEYTKYWEENQEPICEDWLGLDHDGAVLVGDYRFVLSEKKNPVVHVNGGAGIDSKGFLLLPQKRRCHYQIDSQLISAAEWGELCITSERRILCRNKLTLEESDPAIGIATCDHGYLVHTQCGDVFYSSNGMGWQLIGDHASCIAACGDFIAWADAEGNVFLYQCDGHNLGCSCVLHLPGRYVTEMDISGQLAVLKFLDGSFDIINCHTEQSEMGKHYITPDVVSD